MTQLGAPVEDWSPRDRPQRRVLAGSTVRLEPVDPSVHSRALFEASNDPRDPDLWTYLSVGPFPDEDSFTRWIESTARSDDPHFFVVVDQNTGLPGGMVSYMRIVPEHGVIEIGFIWFGGALQRTRGATEAIYLLAHHAFEDLGYRRLEWKCNALNERSRRAALRFGFTFEGVFRQHMVIKGQSRDTAWFAILDGEWPTIKAAFETWLRPENFDAAGQQRRRLAELHRRPRATLDTLDSNAALPVVDVPNSVNESGRGRRSNPDAEANIIPPKRSSR